MTPSRDMFGTRVPGARRFAVVSAVGGAVVYAVMLLAAVWWPHAVVRSCLFAGVFWLNVSIGALGWLMLAHTTGGAWGRTTRRVAEAAALTLPIAAVCCVPVLVGAAHLYAWADAGEWYDDPVLLHRRPWMAWPWVGGRAIVILGIFAGLSVVLRRLSLTQDRATESDEVLTLGRRMRTLSQGGLVVLFVGVFLLSADWIMSLEPHYISSIFGLITLMGQAASAVAAMIVGLWVLEHFGKRPLVPADRVHDLGKLLLTSVVLWAYMSFAQYLVQWMGHTQEDVRWYVRRLHGGWSWVAAALCVLHLGVPLLALLSRPLKRSLSSLAVIAGWVFVMRAVDVLWTIAPSSPGESVGSIYITDAVAWLAIGGIWVGVATWHLLRAPLAASAYLTSGANVTGAVVAASAEGARHG